MDPVNRPSSGAIHEARSASPEASVSRTREIVAIFVFFFDLRRAGSIDWP